MTAFHLKMCAKCQNWSCCSGKEQKLKPCENQDKDEKQRIDCHQKSSFVYLAKVR